MANSIDQDGKSPSLTTPKFPFLTQILLRILAAATSAVAAWLMITNKETEDVFGIQADARYSYSPAFKFFVVANFISVGFSVASLVLLLILGNKPSGSNSYFFIFVLDVIIGDILLGGCAAATAIGYLGKYGNDHTGWMAICDHFAKFCDRGTQSILISYVCVVFYVILALASASASRGRQGYATYACHTPKFGTFSPLDQES